jgi:hypothetical protein
MGIRETIKGRLKHDSQLEERGHERITGELKRKEREKVRSLLLTTIEDLTDVCIGERPL